jgi:hypothetical protein
LSYTLFDLELLHRLLYQLNCMIDLFNHQRVYWCLWLLLWNLTLLLLNEKIPDASFISFKFRLISVTDLLMLLKIVEEEV